MEPSPQMSIEPSPRLVPPASAVYDWAQGDARAKVPSGPFTNHVGTNDCRRFLYSLLSRTDGFQLPIRGIHVPGSNTEIDDFLEWSGLGWSQLMDHSSFFFAWEDGAARASQRVINQVGIDDSSGCRGSSTCVMGRTSEIEVLTQAPAPRQGHKVNFCSQPASELTRFCGNTNCQQIWGQNPRNAVGNML